MKEERRPQVSSFLTYVVVKLKEEKKNISGYHEYKKVEGEPLQLTSLCFCVVFSCAV